MNRDKTIIKTSIIGICGNILLVAGKAVVGILASSISIIMDALNNLTDALSSIITIVGTAFANKKPDKKHPFGYGRIEFLTSTAIAVLIFVAGFMAVYESVVSLIRGEAPEYDVYSFIIISAAIVVKIVLGLFFRMRGKSVDSDALSASGLDALWDSVLSLGTLIGAVVSYLADIHLEGYIGILIGLFIIRSSIEVFKESLSKIIGERTDPELAADMIHDIGEQDGVLGVYDLIVNNYGVGRSIASVHIEVADSMTAKEIQVLERRIAGICYEKYHTIMTVGVYAQNAEGEYETAVKTAIMSIIAKYPDIIQSHGFYMDETSALISLDIVISFDCRDSEAIRSAVYREISEAYPEYHIALVVDHDFSISE